MRGSGISKKLKARVVEASVESTLLFDCQARTWKQGEVRRMQKFMDRCYREVWHRAGEGPLRQMQRMHKKMEDVRRELGVKSVRWSCYEDGGWENGERDCFGLVGEVRGSGAGAGEKEEDGSVLEEVVEGGRD